MDVNEPLRLLGGLSPRAFMRAHWHKQPLLVRQALPGVSPPLTRAALFALAAQDDVESRLVVRREGQAGGARAWSLRRGPLARRALPPLKQPGWTLLVQGLDLHVPAAHDLLSRFRFVPDARLDDLMISYATDRRGVGPHVDAYDVFLVQVQGRRRWRIGPVDDPAFEPGLPLKVLQRFRPRQQWVLEPGDMLYLPPGWGHDGVAEGECMTCSVGFRAPDTSTLAHEVLVRLAEEASEHPGTRYADPRQAATDSPSRIPPALQAFARRAVHGALLRPGNLERALGEVLSEPKPQVWFEPGPPLPAGCGVRLHTRTRMLLDERHLYVNGESWRVGGRDAGLMRRLADARRLDARDCGRLSRPAREVLQQWVQDGWACADLACEAASATAQPRARSSTSRGDHADA